MYVRVKNTSKIFQPVSKKLNDTLLWAKDKKAKDWQTEVENLRAKTEKVNNDRKVKLPIEIAKARLELKASPKKRCQSWKQPESQKKIELWMQRQKAFQALPYNELAKDLKNASKKHIAK